jgi:hypothetical protein
MIDRPEDQKLPLYREFEALAEEAYNDMCEGRIGGRWSDIKEYFSTAIEWAERAGLRAEAERLRKRFDLIRNIVQSQFG